MNDLILDEENAIDTSILLNSNDYSNAKHEFNASASEIQNSLISCKKELLSMKNEVLINLQNGLKSLSSSVENLPSTIREKRSSRLKLQTAIRIVNDIISLRKCNQDFVFGMSRKDYDFCANCISEYLKIRSSCINLEKKTCDELDKGREELYLQLKELIEENLSAGELEKAIHNVKLFVPMGMPEEGLERYIKYIRGNITDLCVSMYNEALSNSKKTSERVNYADIFAGLFVSIIECINEHQEKILELFVTLDYEDLEAQDCKQALDRNYVVWYFYTELLREVNTQGSIIVDKFEKDYHIYLDDRWTNIENINILEMGVSHRELDGFLEEMSQICNLFYKFKVYMNDLINSIKSIDSHALAIKMQKPMADKDQIPTESNLFDRIDEMSIRYVSCEYGYIIYSINHALNETDEISWEDQDSLISTLVEDIFFLLHKTINRCIMIGNIRSLKLIIVHLNHILLNVVKQKIVQNLQNSRAYYEISLGNSNEGISKFTLSRLLETIKQNNDNCQNFSNSMYSWTHSINNLQVCIENMEILSETIVRDFGSTYHDLTYFDTCINGISRVNDVELKANGDIHGDKNLTIEYINRTFEQIVSEFKVINEYYSKISLQILSKISISPILIQLHEEISFEFSESESKDYSINQSFIPSLTYSLKVIDEHLRNFYNSQSSEFIISLMIERIVQKIEHIIINYPEKKRFTIYGALVFENDVRNLLSFTNSLVSISVRHKFLRLLEICDILNVTSLEELSDLLITDFPSRNWHLTKSDILKTLFLKQDIDHEKLKEMIKRSSHFFN
ncbi:oligomeric golgi complex protein 4 [Cryptosporidium canis]|uniref:Conserved oligomeric Golgi complex subunit 4 n=1 Tax=Cryptosporidium canis TaxID=195482 RepID=A0ABQ8PD68_9CRYT|nr:oligomeric golgi complex protein 4 [Cryptosporidium canis]KAJ1614503.1 oligomeric golgi complex protein 4 [Cryptosporidium canis]